MADLIDRQAAQKMLKDWFEEIVVNEMVNHLDWLPAEYYPEIKRYTNTNGGITG